MGISTKLISECNKIYEQIRTILSGLMGKLKEKIEHFKKEVIAKVEEAYGDFIARYGNMTREEVISKVQDVSLRKYNEILKELRKIMVVFETEYKAISKKLIALKTEMKKIYNEFLEFYPFVKAKIVELKKYVVNKYNEIKPKVISLYNKYEKLLREETNKMVSEMKAMYTKVHAKAIMIYDQIKNKNLKELVMKVKTEVMVEMGSIINQTLRNTVTLAKLIIKAYTPHIRFMKNVVEKYILPKVRSAIQKVRILIGKINLKNIEKIIKETIAKVEKKMKELIEKIKTNDKYIKIVAKLKEMKKLIK